MGKTSKKFIAALAMALMATLGVAAPADAGNVKLTRIGGGWCC